MAAQKTDEIKKAYERVKEARGDGLIGETRFHVRSIRVLMGAA